MSVEVTREPIGVVGLITPWKFPDRDSRLEDRAGRSRTATAWCSSPPISCRAAVGAGDILTARPAGRRVQPRHGARRGGRRGHPPAPGIDGIQFHRLPGGRPAHRRGSIQARREVPARDGGKNPLVVLDDAQLDQAVEVAVQGSFYSTGQRCTASSRIIVTQGIHDTFVSRLAERARALVVGDARDPKTQIGPVVDARQLEQDERYISIGKTKGRGCWPAANA